MAFNIEDRPRRNILLSCDHGLMIINRFDCNHEQVGHGQWLLDHGNCSTIEAFHCFNILKNIDEPTILDIGANIGTFTTWISKAFPNGCIHSFEPQHAIFQQLAGNIAINNLYNVFTYNIALGSENKYIEFYEPDYFSMNDFGVFSLVKQKNIPITTKKIIVQMLTVDKFIEIYKIKKIDLIKIDAEGMDIDVLNGALDSIKKYRPKIFIEHYDNEKSIKEEIISFIKPLKYNFELIDNNMLAY